ncbi:uncharacterized protein LOC120261812 [Dioscorea cayenensis subsp. rotundata]|uniref:Uncharacterized protein LOC120261812 n=1 Tax=Dioscorea cayennensis subsp. rotundata TaxID=55577 RepID=A0AB40BEJ0_DIOCR|nr:uncharacterized protein LOC120261812 [Dioscorea cayenensis subsp. rotundata]
MAASANPTGNQDGAAGGGGAAGNPNNGAAAAAPAAGNASGPGQGLKHNPGLAIEWTSEEQTILEDGLAKYASDASLIRYAKIAMELQDKTVRDVALRCRWMTKKESGKRRKEELARKNKDKKERATDSSTKPSTHLAARPSAPQYALPMLPVDNDDDISYRAIGGATGQLLEQNMQAFNQISTNLANFLLQDNINLFQQTYDNILTIMNEMNEMPEIMKQMPPLPVKVNEELANSILPPPSVPRQSGQ